MNSLASPRFVSRFAAAATTVALACGISGSAHAAKVRHVPIAPASAYRFEGVVYDRLFGGFARAHTVRPGVAALAGTRPYSSIKDVGDPNGFGYPLGVNNKGDIVYYDDCECVGNFAGGNFAYVIHDDGSTTLLFYVDAGDITYSAIPYAINNTGDEAGMWSMTGPVVGLYNHIDWTPTREYADPARVDSGSFALAINDGNVSVGQAPVGGVTGAALFSITPAGNNARPKALLPPKGTAWVGTATGINNAGKIVGYGTFGKGQGRALEFALGGYAHVLPVGPPGISTSAQAVNQHGDVVGSAGSEAFLYRNNRVTYLPRPPGETAGNAVAYAINASDEVVGDIITPTGYTPFLYANGHSYDLNSLLPANSGWSLVHAAGINDAGEIVGTGNDANSAFGYGGSFAMKP